MSYGLPTRAALRPDGLYLELRDIAANQLGDPFMQETVRRVAASRSILEIPSADVGAMAADMAPVGLIFHVARCGSTLASQLLKLSGRAVVYAEPPPMNELIVPPRTEERSKIVGALRSLGAAFARHARGRYVLKLSSWNVLFCDIIAEAFPSTPWALCVRDPVEVCVSIIESRPGWLRDAGAPAHVFRPVIDPLNEAPTFEDYVAQMYGAFCRAAANLDLARGLLLRYETLPDAIWTRLAPHFDLLVDDALQRRMAEASRVYSKAPLGRTTAFVPDDATKRRAASLALLRAIDARARPALDALTARFSPRQIVG